jgi:CubicO group peptidase (beta-lactamase class C family)
MTKIKSTVLGFFIALSLCISYTVFSEESSLERVEQETASGSTKNSESLQSNPENNSKQKDQLPDAQEQAKVSPTSIDELKSAIREVMQDKNVPAVGVAMLDENGPVWVGSLGLANIEDEIAADENSLYRIGSTSKMFVALSVLQLVEQGKLSLADKVRDLVPEVEFENPWSDTNPVLVEHLLEHTTGWDDLHLVEYANNDPTPVTLKEGLDFHPHSRVSRWIPGSRSSYCNSGPPVAAYIVEKITGQRFEDYIQENFFNPLGMQTATYFYDEKVKAKGVTLYDTSNHPQDYWHIIMRPSGSINASPVDMSKFLQFYLNRGTINGQPLVQPASLNRMETVKTTNAAKVGLQAGYGLNNYTSLHKSWVYREHNGGVNGGLTELSYLPSANLGHVIMINSGNAEAFREISKLIRNYETRRLTPDLPSAGIPLTDKHKAIAGLYYPINSRQQMGYFIDRIVKAQSFQIDGDKLIHKSIFGADKNNYFALSDNLFSSDDNHISALAIASDPLVGDVLHLNNTVYKPTSSLLAYGQLFMMGLWIVAVVSSILFSFVWGIRKLDGKIPKGGATRIRIWPLLASLSVVLFIILFISGAADPFKNLGEPSVFSIGIMLTSMMFALFSFIGVYTAIKEKKTLMNQAAYWYCSVSSVLHFIVSLYLLWFGVIGMMTWG